MAELVAVRLALSVAWKLFAPRTASKIQNGDVTEEKLRQMLLNEFQKLHEHLNALRRKELVASVAFLETGYDLLEKNPEASQDEFRKARDASLMAFGVVAEVGDKVLATKILITSAIHEFRDNKETAKTLCLKYLTRLNSLPEVTKICQVTYEHESNLKSKLLGLTGKDKRLELLRGVADTNYSLWEFFLQEFPESKEPWPRITWDKGNTHPVYDMCILRSSYIVAELDIDVGRVIASVVCKGYIFCATGQSHKETQLQNTILAVNIDTGQVTHLIGHSANVLCLAASEDRVFSASYDKKVMVWDAGTLEFVAVLEEHTGAIRSMCISDEYLYTGSTDSTVMIWSLETLKLCKKIEIASPVSYITCSKRKYLFCLHGLTKLQIWDITKVLNESISDAIFETKVDLTVSKVMSSENLIFVCSKANVDVIKLGNLRKESTINVAGNDWLLTSSNKFLILQDQDSLNLVSTRNGKCVLTEKMFGHGEVLEQIWTHEGALFACYVDEFGKRKYIRKW
eukprot:gene13929-15381_t